MNFLTPTEADGIVQGIDNILSARIPVPPPVTPPPIPLPPTIKPFQLINYVELYKLEVDKAYFPPADYDANGKLTGWWTHLCQIPMPDTLPGDLLMVSAQVVLASQDWKLGAFCPFGITVRPLDEPVIYDNPTQHAGYKNNGQVLRPFSGEDVHAAPYYVRPYYRQAGWWRYLVPAGSPPVTIHYWVRLSSVGAGNSKWLNVAYTGGESALFVEQYRRV